MADYYDLCHRMFMAVPVRLFGIDQTIAEGAFFVAMQAAGFPHTVVVLSEGYGPIVHRLHLHLADTAYRVNQTNGGLLTGDILNCYDQPYYIVHQLNWRPKMWEARTAALLATAGSTLA
jgi:hypothetical protein